MKSRKPIDDHPSLPFERQYRKKKELLDGIEQLHWKERSREPILLKGLIEFALAHYGETQIVAHSKSRESLAIKATREQICLAADVSEGTIERAIKELRCGMPIDRAIKTNTFGCRFIRIIAGGNGKPIRFVVLMTRLIEAIESAAGRSSLAADVDQWEQSEATDPQQTPRTPPANFAEAPAPPAPPPAAPAPPASPPANLPKYLTPSLTPIPKAGDLSKDLPPEPRRLGKGVLKKFNEKAIKSKMPAFLHRPFNLETAWQYLLQDLRAGPRAREVAYAVGLSERTEVFELAYLAWCACVIREDFEQRNLPPEQKFKPIGLFINGLKGDYMGEEHQQLWTQRATLPDEDKAREFLKAIKAKKPEETAVVLAASSFSIDKSIMKGLPE